MNDGNHKVLLPRQDPRVELVKVCPSGCNPPMIMQAVPNLTTNLNSFARCVRCGLYWEVNSFGLIINKRQWLESGAAPKVPEEKKE